MKKIKNIASLIFHFNVTHTCVQTLLNSYDGFILLDKNKNIIYENDKASLLLPHNEIDISSLFNDDTDGYSKVYSINTNACHKYVDTKYQILRNKSGIIIGSYLVLHDVTDFEESRIENEFILRHDVLTGLYNKNEFVLQSKTYVMSHRNNECVLIILDVNKFKMINYSFGSDIGNMILCRIASFIQRHIGHSGIYGRLNDDKFALLITPDQFNEELFFKQISDELSMSFSNMNYEVSVCAGACTINADNYNEDDFDFNDFINRSRIALSEAKNKTANQVVWFSSDMVNAFDK